MGRFNVAVIPIRRFTVEPLRVLSRFPGLDPLLAPSSLFEESIEAYDQRMERGRDVSGYDM